MKQKARHLRKDLFIVDTGDTHDGNYLHISFRKKFSVTKIKNRKRTQRCNVAQGQDNAALA